jgi:lipid II:glycine glycyltransferase (peptidoglycan interpeptide bridge formation enzyme)
MAPALMAAIRAARDAGCEVFDLGGVPLPEDRDEKRVNIARFKFDFASSPVRLVGEHARWF